MQISNSSPIARFLIVMAAFIIVVAGMREAKDILVPFLLSLFIAIICTPLLSIMKRYRIPTGISILLIVLIMVIVGIVIGALVGSSINSFTTELPQYQARLVQLSAGLQEWLVSMGIIIDQQLWKEVFNPSAALTLASKTLSSFGNIMTDGFMILLTVTFILAEEVNFIDKFKQAANSDDDNKSSTLKTIDALSRFTNSIKTYMAIKTLVSLATGLLVMVALMVIGVDYPILWGMLAFMLNFIPTFGSILAAIPPVLLAIIQLGFGEAIITAMLYVTVNIVVGSIIEPRVMGKGLDLSSLVVFLSLIFWGWVLGPVGMLLSVPLTIMVKIALENSQDTQWIGVLLGSTAKTK